MRGLKREDLRQAIWDMTESQFRSQPEAWVFEDSMKACETLAQAFLGSLSKMGYSMKKDGS